MQNFKDIVSFLKDKGFVFASSEIYGGLANSWDYGPLGAMLKQNIRALWIKEFIDSKENVFQFDSSIILNSKVWETSGHLGKFNDPMIECLNDNKRYRADELILKYTKKDPASLSNKEMTKIIQNDIKLKQFGTKTKWGEVKNFQLMFGINDSKTDLEKTLYLRPEIAQGIYINFKNILNTYNPTLPFGVGQIGKSFRNEVTPGNFIFRTREFEQMELQYFVKPEDEIKYFNALLKQTETFLKKLNVKSINLRKFDVPKKDLAHYSKKTVDFEYKFEFGWGELLGLANRSDFDLTNHLNSSKQNLYFLDQTTNKKIIPHIIELSIGIERLFLAIISSNLEKKDNEWYLKLPYHLSPYKLAVAPLTNKLEKEAHQLFTMLLEQDFGPILYSKGGTIGKRYRKLDQISVPFVITYDFETLTDHKVTIRDYKSKKQERIEISKIKEFILEHAK